MVLHGEIIQLQISNFVDFSTAYCHALIPFHASSSSMLHYTLFSVIFRNLDSGHVLHT